MAANQVVDVTSLIDQQKLGPLHWRVLALCTVLLLIDGYDVLAAAFVAPMLQKEWGLSSSDFGPLFGSALVGSALGPMLFGYFADRFGRRPLVLIGTLWFGVFTTAAVWATSLNQLMVLRLLAGLGFGAVISIVTAFVSEFAPRRLRGTMIVIAFMGVLLGGGLGALVASQILGTYGWRAVFWIGGLIPIAFAIVGFFAFPESIRFLALRPARRAELVLLLKRLNPNLAVSADAHFMLSDEANAARFSFKALFAGRLAAITPLLWVSNFVTLLMLYFVSQWAPILLTNAGAPIQRATLATAAFQICGFFAALAVMRPVDKVGFLPVPILFAFAVPIIASMGISGLSDIAVIALAGAAGFCVIGIQLANVATQSQVYPTYVRAWGVGSCFGAGRFGALVGAVLAGGLIGIGISIDTLFYLAGATMIVGVVSGILLVPLYRNQLRDMRESASRAVEMGGNTEPAAVINPVPAI